MATARRLKNDSFLEYVEAIEEKYKTRKATEHTYRGILEDYVCSFETRINAVNEPKRVACGAPDYIVTRGKVPLGYIEAKDVGESLDKGEKSKQLIRYFSSLGNLILTDYLEFRWYVNGEKRLTVRIADIKNGKIHIRSDAREKIAHLFSSFLNTSVPVVKSASELAERLAGSTKNICALICDVYETESKEGWLHRWHKAFAEVLIHDLDKETFADMFAQTLAYGFFAARIHHEADTEFSRFAAAKILPKTNPFLRQLFAEFTGVNMPEEISWAVDEVIELLKVADIKSILSDFGQNTGKEDPVVHFYETFLNSYNPKLRERRGVYYTPSPVVDYIAKSVDEILQTHFDRPDGLADDKTLILDPAVGTASFLYKVIDIIKGRFSTNAGMWDSYVGESLLHRLFGFEILMAPYSVSHLKLGLQLQETGYKFTKNQRLGVYLTNTLEETAKKSQEMLFNWISDEANAASSIKKDKPIMVVIGNPPYSGESENNGDWINGLMRGYDSITETETANYFQCEGKPLGERNPRWLNDDYVKFIRFSQWRIEQTGHGILAFVTNHGFLDNPTFRGMRESLIKTFDEIYLLDLHGNVKKKEVSPDGSKDQNVFDIQQGVCISFFVKKKENTDASSCKVFRSDLWGERLQKYEYLSSRTISNTEWTEIEPRSPYFLFSEQNLKVWDEYNLGLKITDIFKVHSAGLIAGRDSLAMQYSEDEIWETVNEFKNTPTEQARVKWKLGKDARDWKVADAQADLKSSKLNRENIIRVQYRPFDTRYTYYTGKAKGFLRWPKPEITPNLLAGNNIALITSRMTKGEDFAHVHFSKDMAETISLSAKTSNNAFVFPLFLFKGEDQLDLGDSASLNFKDDFLGMIQARYGKKISIKKSSTDISGEDIFGYISAILSSSDFQKKYNQCLKVDFAKIPFPQSFELFKKLSVEGTKIIQQHLGNSSSNKDCKFPIRGPNVVESIEYKDEKLFINESQYFSNITRQVFNFKVGGYSVCEKWLKSRKGRKLSFDEIKIFINVVSSVSGILKCQNEIDSLIKANGGISQLFKQTSLASSIQISKVKESVEKIKDNVKGKKLQKVSSN